MNRIGFWMIASIVILGCSARKTFHLVSTDHPVFVPDSAFVAFEDLTSPKFLAFKEKFQLDTIFHGETDEFKRMLLLRNWIRTVMKISDFEESYPGDGFAEKILDAGLEGHGFHCGHYMIVQNAVMNSYGYVTRCLGAGPGVKGGPDGHHGINEIWSDKFQKWFLSDAKYNHHFEKNGIPLSALEIRDEYLKNKVADVVLVKGPDRKPIEGDGVANRKQEMVNISKERFAQTYTWIEWERSNDRFTRWPKDEEEDGKLNMLADPYFESHTWIWDNKPHWSYHTKFMVKVPDRKAIEWTPNTVKADVKIEGDVASVDLHSSTPNLKTYQILESPEGEWKDVSNPARVELTRDENKISFRTLNLAGVVGAEYKMTIAR